MDSDYAGLHTFEWGYLAATLIAFFLWLLLLMPERATRAASSCPDEKSDFLALALVFAAAFGLAVDAWFFEERVFSDWVTFVDSSFYKMFDFHFSHLFFLYLK